jgi:2-iminobutanoate/2-iminopropanoate deaminase
VLERIHTEKAPFVSSTDGAEPPFSQAIRFGDLIFTSAQGPLDPVTDEVPTDFAAQVRQVLDNVVAVAHAGGSRKDLIIRCTCYLRDQADFGTFNRVYREFFIDTSAPPARTTVVAQLVREGVLVEIDAVAALA